MQCTAAIGRRIGVATLCIFICLSCAAIGVYSFMQIGSTTKLNINSEPFSIDCGAQPYSNHRPFQFHVDGADGQFKCPWPTLNSALRISFMFAVPLVFLPLVFLGIYKKQTWAVWALAPLSILGVVVTFGLMVLDANSVRVGADWCANGEKPWSQSQITCQFTAFISMTFTDSTAIILWAVQTGIIFWFAYLKMKDDFTDWDLDYGDSPSEKLLAEESYKAARARI